MSSILARTPFLLCDDGVAGAYDADVGSSGAPGRSRSVALPFGDVEVAVHEGRVVAVRVTAARARACGAECRVGESAADDDPVGGDAALLELATRQLAEYGEGRRASFDLPLAPARTPFAAALRAALGEVGLGETVTYGALAAAVGRPRGARAVGAAMASNPLPILVPCHRVVASDGSLGGYAGGAELKAAILDHEARVAGASPALVRRGGLSSTVARPAARRGGRAARRGRPSRSG